MPGEAPSRILATLERGLVGLAVGLGSLAWIALLLAELGRLNVGTVAVAAIGALALGWSATIHGIRNDRTAGGSAPDGGPVDEIARWWPRTAAAAVVVLGVLGLFFPAYETTLWAGDSTVYLAFASRIGETGALVFEDPLVGSLPVPLRRDVFRNTTPLDTTGPYARFPGGFRIPDIDDDEVTAGFSPLFPVVLAVFDLMAGQRGMLLVAPLFAALAVCAVFFIGSRLGGVWAGLLAAALVTVCLPQIWYARFSVPESLAEFLVLAGVLTLYAASSRRGPTLPLASGALLGLAALAKVDIAVLGGVALVLLGGWTLARTVRWPRQLGWLSLGFALPLAHMLVHYLVFPTHYTRYVLRRVRTSALTRLLAEAAGDPRWLTLLICGTVVLSALVWLAARRWSTAVRTRLLAAILLALVGIYFVNYFASTAFGGTAASRWLVAYLRWPLLALAALGAMHSLTSPDVGWRGRLLPILALVVCAHYLYNPYAGGEPLWDIRRFVPVVVPACAILAAVAVFSLVQRLPRAVRAAGSGSVAAGLIVITAAPGLALTGGRPWAGTAAWARDLVGVFPDGSVILVGPDLAGTHLATSLGYLHGLDTVQVQERHGGTRTLDELVRYVRTSGRRVCLVVGNEDFPVFAPDLSLREEYRGRLAVTTLDTTATGQSALAERATPITVYQGEPRRPEELRFIDVGDARDDLLFAPRGFYAPEGGPSSEESFRWTGPRASLRLPPFSTVRLHVDGGRPRGLAAPGVSIALDGVTVESLSLVSGPTEILVRNPQPDATDPVELTITSEVFTPQQQGLSSDSRRLGVKVFGLDLLPAAADTR